MKFFIAGITNTVGRVLIGWVSDRPWADALLINNVALMIGGAATIASPFCTNYAMFAAYSVVFGCGIGKNKSIDLSDIKMFYEKSLQ